MLKDFLSKWNPLNIFGLEVKIEDIIQCPLKPHETLMQDCRGHFHRITAPLSQSSCYARLLFWLQTHLNSRGHLDAINAVVQQLQSQLMQNPPYLIDALKTFNENTEVLRCLKNDYYFSYLQQGNPQVVDEQISDIQRQAYSIFAKMHHQQVEEQEQKRRDEFFAFYAYTKREIEKLASVYSKCFQDNVMTTDQLKCLTQRLDVIEDLCDKINQMKVKHQGKFTIPSVHDYFQTFHLQLKMEIEKVLAEMTSSDQKQLSLSEDVYEKIERLKKII